MDKNHGTPGRKAKRSTLTPYTAGEDSTKVCALTQTFVAEELANLLPLTVSVEASESPRPSKALPEEWVYDAEEVAADNLKNLVQDRGTAGTILISAGPWRAGAIIDGIKRFTLAQQLNLPFQTETVEVADLMAAKLIRWRSNISVVRSVPAYQVVKAFLRDADFKAYFDGLVKQGKKNMSEGGKKKGKKESASTPGFNRRLEAAKFCAVKPWDFFFASEIFKFEINLETLFPEELWVDAKRQIRRAEIGEVGTRNVYVDLKNKKADTSRKATINAASEIKNQPTENPKVWESGRGNIVYHGDCFTILPQIGDGEIDRIVTSPDYYGAKIKYGEEDVRPKTWAEYCEKMRFFIAQCWRVLKADGMLIINLSDTDEDSAPATAEGRLINFHDHRGLVMETMRSLGVHSAQPKIWDKGDTYAKKVRWGSQANPAYRADCEHILVFFKGKRVPAQGYILSHDETKKYTMAIWHCNAQPDDRRRTDDKHPAVWPKALLRPLVGFGAKRGDVLLDPFAGSGALLEYAASEGLIAIGIEQNGTWVKRAQKGIDRGIEEWAEKKRKAIEAPAVKPDFD